MSEAAQAVQSQKPETFAAKAYAAKRATSALSPYSFQRRKPLADDVQIEILYCGVCHSDLHYTRNEWSDAMPAVYPAVPGHEIVGRVVAVGKNVKRFKEGDIAAVGCMVKSCGICVNCKAGEEQYCNNEWTL